MKIFDDPKAPNSRSGRIFLAEKGITISFEHMEFMRSEHKIADFLTKIPMAQLPVPEPDDGRFLGEAVSICRYFENLYPDPSLKGQPGDTAGLARWRGRVSARPAHTQEVSS